jgi:hypothetical protein
VKWLSESDPTDIEFAVKWLQLLARAENNVTAADLDKQEYELLEFSVMFVLIGADGLSETELRETVGILIMLTGGGKGSMNEDQLKELRRGVGRERFALLHTLLSRLLKYGRKGPGGEVIN